MSDAVAESRMRRAFLSVWCALLTITQPFSATAQNPGDLAKVEAAIPAKPTVVPGAPRKLLVFTLCKGFAHSSIPLGVATLEKMGLKTGAYSVVASDDPAVFAPENLAQFHAVCMLNTTGELFEDAALRKSLVDFVKGGKGLVGIHAATDCFYDWPEYGAMMGGYFDGHPWGGGDSVICALDDPAHPLTAMFKGREFSITDEIYQFKPQPYSRDKVRVLVSLNVEKTDMDKGGLKRADNDYPISWIQHYGQGRVFYCSLGHNESTYWNATVLQHYLDGIQFAIGDLPADATPSNLLPPEQREQSRAAGLQILVDEAFKDIAQYQNGQDASVPKLIHDWIISSHEDTEMRSVYERRLLAVLESNPTPDARRLVVALLRLCATDEAVPKFAALLASPDTANEARYVLERLDTPAAAAALRAALPLSEGLARIGIINSLGERRDKESLMLIAPFARHDDSALAEAAQTALGKIGGADAEKALLSALAVATSESSPTLIAACVGAALSREARGERAAAAELYTHMLELAPSVRCQVAALQGLATTDSARATPRIIDALKSPEATVQAGAATAARSLPGEAASESLADALAELSAPAQILLINALEDRGEPVALDAVNAAVQHADPAVVRAAVAALGALGNASSVALLGNLAAKADDDLAPIARASLARLRGVDVDNSIVAALAPADSSVRRELVRTLGARNARAAVSALLGSANDPDETVRAELYTTLAKLASPDQLQPIIGMLAAEQSDAARVEAEKAVIALLDRSANPVESAAIALAVLPEVKQGIPGYCSMLRVLGKINDPTTLDALRAATDLKNPEVRATAVRALAEWETNASITDLLELARTTEEAPLRDIALRGYLRMIEMPQNDGDLPEQYGAALIAARTGDERKVVFASIANQRDPRLAAVVLPYAEDPAVKQEAALTLEHLRTASISFTASHNSEELGLAHDGNPTTRWTTRERQKAGQWLVIDLGYMADVSGITLDTGASPGDYPREYKVLMSQDAAAWGEPVASGQGSSFVTEIKFAPQRARYLRIEQSGEADDLWWSIHELRVHIQ
ncbi:MAG: ThuA domain-containing protein [Candidatus Hydrogenedentes bacterium]|nr:ThuA domain-containing protein [Candidatus Hydrogenedentota bacterium]